MLHRCMWSSLNVFSDAIPAVCNKTEINGGDGASNSHLSVENHSRNDEWPDEAVKWLYDGLCGLIRRVVDFIYAHDY